MESPSKELAGQTFVADSDTVAVNQLCEANMRGLLDGLNPTIEEFFAVGRVDWLLDRNPSLLAFIVLVKDAQTQCLLFVDTTTSYAMQEADAMVLVNVMRIPCFGRRMTIGRASICWPGAS
jgi:hypothetical protein